MTIAKQPTKEEIREELGRVCESEEFSGSARLRDFLNFIVEKSLNGEEDQIKGYTIGIEVFEKPENFNPDIDSSVRVEASRLRKALKLYYHSKGKNNPVEIRIPKGAYKPSFSYSLTEEMHDAANKPSASSKIAYGIIALFCIAAAFAAWFAYEHHAAEHIEGDHPYVPVVAVLPFESSGSREAAEVAESMTLSLTDNLLKFSEIEIHNIHAETNLENWSGNSAEIVEDSDASYLIEGFIENNGDTFDVTIRVLDAPRSNYIWTHKKSHETLPDDINDLIENTSSDVAAQVASPYGVVMNYELDKRYTDRSKAYLPYKCVLNFYTYANNKSQDGHTQVTKCLQDTLEKFPDHAESWAYLSWMYGDIKRYNFKPAESLNGQDLKELVMETARQAVKISPNKARTQQYFSTAAEFNGDTELMKRHIRLALSLNPNDTEVLAEAAWRYGLAGDWELARRYAEKAIELNPGHPRWYHGILYIYYFRAGNYSEALLNARKTYQPDNLNTSLALCSSYAALKRTKEAREIAQHIRTKFPEFIENPKEMLEVWKTSPVFYEKLVIALELAGLEIESED